MDVLYRTISIVAICIIILIVIITWLWYRNPQHLLTWWNQHIKSECDQQDELSLNGIPSYQDAWHANDANIVNFHRLIHINHDDILAEILDMLEDDVNKSKPILDSISDYRWKWIHDNNQWNPIWIRYMGNWSNLANLSPTLKRITSLFSNVNNVYVSVFYPGSTLIENQGSSRSIYKYHYGLKISDDDVGLKIGGFDIKWKEREGYIWDDTIPHSVWNHTSEPRIVIFADIFRDFSLINSVGSRLVYSLLQRNKHVIQIKNQLQNNH